MVMSRFDGLASGFILGVAIAFVFAVVFRFIPAEWFVNMLSRAMLPLRLILSLMLVAVLAYTGVVVSSHGLDLFSVFFVDMARMGWAGQFNLDFMCMLALSGLWVAWRHRFSPGGLALALMAFLLGTPFLWVYLLAESRHANGDVRALLLGPRLHDCGSV
jgi:hypothetical protein